MDKAKGKKFTAAIVLLIVAVFCLLGFLFSKYLWFDFSYDESINEYCTAYGVEKEIVYAVIKAESGFDEMLRIFGLEPPLRREDIPQLDFVIISHDHYDHLEYGTVKFLKDRDVKFVTALGVGARLRGWGVPADRIIELGWEESAEVAGLTITAERSRHFSGRHTNDRDSTLWASYVIEDKNDRRVFFGADSGYGRHFKEIGEKYGGFDLTCLEIDAWNENWPNNHMFPEESVRAHNDLRGKKYLPIHWGVFDLAMHPWNESIGKAKEAAKKENVELVDVLMGEKKVLE